eukprot:3427211-Karenia_brevis.AAC.1
MGEQPSNISTPSEVVTFQLDLDIEDELLENVEQSAENLLQNDNPDAEAWGDPHEGVKTGTSQSSSSRQYPNEKF